MSDNFNELDNSSSTSPESYPAQNDMNHYLESGRPVNTAGPYSSRQEASSGSYAYVSENSQKIKKQRNHPFLKATAFVLCLAIVGVGSVQGYRIYQDHNERSGYSEYKDDDTKKNQKVNSLFGSLDDDEEQNNADMPSLIELAARKDSKSIPDIVDDIMPSVVGVSSVFEYQQQSYSFFGWGGGDTKDIWDGQGTGIIISEDGYIATNAHCIYDDSERKSGEAIEVSVRFSDESQVSANIIAYDLDTDLAVLKVSKSGLKPAVFGDSNDLRVGELVIAVGNPLGFELFGSVTSGIVSALNRNISINEKNMNLIQTDAPINAGNSGGPLLNSCGQVVGINSAKMSSTYGSASVEGLGFAIPISDAKAIIDDLIHYNYVRGRPQFGINTADINEASSRYYNIPVGVYVSYVAKGSAADIAGIKERDVIIEVAGETVTTTAELNTIKNRYKAGDTITVTVNRGSEDINLDVTLQEANSGGSKNTEKSDNKKR
jgi:serine protease Do